MKKFNAVNKDHSSWKDRIKKIKENSIWSSDMTRLAVRILEYLDDHGKSQRWLAMKMDVTPQYISNILAGKNNLSWGTIKKIEKVIGIKLAYIESSPCSNRTVITTIKNDFQSSDVWQISYDPGKSNNLNLLEGWISSRYRAEIDYSKGSIFNSVEKICESYFIPLKEDSNVRPS